MDESKIKRKCIACNSVIPRNSLIKITVNTATKEVRVSPDSFFTGRSAYICKNKECFETAFKKGKIFRFLKIKQEDSLKEKIRAVLEN